MSASPEKSPPEAPVLDAALARVRRYREDSEWPPLTVEDAVDQRGRRIAEVRRGIQRYREPVVKQEPDTPSEKPLAAIEIHRRLLLGLFAMILIPFLFWHACNAIMSLAEIKHQADEAQTKLPFGETELSDSVAIWAAFREMDAKGYGTRYWKLTSNGVSAEDGLPTYVKRDPAAGDAACITFQQFNGAGKIQAEVRLVMDRVECVLREQ